MSGVGLTVDFFLKLFSLGLCPHECMLCGLEVPGRGCQARRGASRGGTRDARRARWCA